MIDLDYQLGFPYQPAVIFAVLANVADYPAWQSDVASAMTRSFSAGARC